MSAPGRRHEPIAKREARRAEGSPLSLRAVPIASGATVGAVMTACANHYIRSKRQFEEAYAAAKL